MIDKWILKRFNEVLENVTENMEKYEFALVGNELYNFVWDDFCSWYIELSKAGLQSADATVVTAARSTLVIVLRGIVRMLHPFMPFVTEEIYQAIPHLEESICISKYPTVKKDIAIVVDKNITAGDIAMQIKKRLYLEWQCILQQILLHIQPIVITMEHGTV